MMSLDMNASEFLYLLSRRRDEALFPRCEPVCLGRELLQLTERTRCAVVREEHREICVAGVCVDSLGRLDREAIPAALLRAGKDGLAGVLAFEPRLAGRYIILYTEGERSWILNDATGAMQVFYHTVGEMCCAAAEGVVAGALALPYDERNVEIRKGSDCFQPMPYDATCVKDVRCLLPGHHLCLNTGEVTRFQFFPRETDDTEKVLSETARQIDNITLEYAKLHPLLCPITGGWDSRTNLSFLMKNGLVPETYTFDHPEFTSETEDLTIPDKMCAALGISHTVIPDVPEDRAAFDEIAAVMGPHISGRTVRLARTYRSVYDSEHILLTGDTVAQIGKHVLGNRLSWRAATARFLTCKIHNASAGAVAETTEQLKEYARTGCREGAFDLFSLESRCGRWASRITTIYAMHGIQALNLYNCRSVLTAWMSLPVEDRCGKCVHKYYLRRNAPQLLEFPFNSRNWQDSMKDKAFTFWLATYGKYWLMKLKKR
jgi:hypothetical protein